jgi:3-hydroxyacyl-CoA dehydrogenase
MGMERKIQKVAILGSGVMGSGIACHLANAGISSYLLDIVPNALTDAEKAKGLSLDSPAVRNRIVNRNFQSNVVKMKPPGLMSQALATRITVGNMEDDLAWLSECDWIVEVVAENLEIKKSVLKKIEPYVKAGTVVSTNTSGISINKIAEDMPASFRLNWLGIHFFNPVRYMQLAEVIPGKETDPELCRYMTAFLEHRLGKTVVPCKDTPCFIANRIGAAIGSRVMSLTVEYGLTIADVDALTGPVLGRPKTACYRLIDLVGLDIGTTSPKTVANNIDDEAEKALFAYPGYVDEMMADGAMGDKAGRGFYKKDGKNRLMYDYKAKSYVPVNEVRFASLDAANAEKTQAGKLTAFFEGDDTAAKFVWTHMKQYLLHAAGRIPEISDDIVRIDRAMELGFNLKAGPFRIWNGVDIAKYLARMEAEGETVPGWLKEMLAAGVTSFYTKKDGKDYYYSIPDKKYMPVEIEGSAISVAKLSSAGKCVKEFPGVASIYDMGDDIICFEIQTKNAALSPALSQAMHDAYEELNRNWAGMVLASSGNNFCVGADLKESLAPVMQGDLSGVVESIQLTQNALLKNKYSPRPIVVAPYGMTLGGGCEIAMQCAAVQAAGETYMGLVEIGVGLIPGGGGTKELTLRALERPEGTLSFNTEFLLAALQLMAGGKVSSSAYDAIELGYMRKGDGISLSRAYQLSDAKQKVLGLVAGNYAPPLRRTYLAPGINDNGILITSAKAMKEAGYISDYDYFIIKQLAYIMTGGGVSKGQVITEEYLLSLEQEVFVGLLKEKRTLDRIEHMMTKGKPLRN